MKFTCYSDWAQLPESAEALFAQLAHENIFYTRPWFECLSACTLEDQHSLLLACVEADNQLLAMLPLLRHPSGSWSALRHRYTPHFSLLLASSQQQAVLSCLTQGLSSLPLDGLILEPVAKDDPQLAGFTRAMQAAGFSCEFLFRHYNWVYRVNGQGYADYLASRSAQLRNTIARKQRKLEREHDYQLRLFSGMEVPSAMADYNKVYRASWKASEQYSDFVQDMVARFSQAGWTRLGVLYINGQAVAAQLWFVCQHKASIFRLSYDETWKAYSPGTILTSFLMQHVIDVDRVDEIDFLTGNEAYKQEWMSDRHERFALSCVRAVKARTGFHPLVTALKRWLTSR